ncbi:MAG: hypothetical protein P0Y64_17395 [Candidatus Sphingomonas colombiensis]|nr:hypothetical protein [Sphingomonas sp.]WEK43086.1 MAG: hypothetical protein P0Y64_17395 [Sphingomonas sp.]
MIRTASYRSSSYQSQVGVRGRVGSLLLSLAVGVLVVLALITVGAITGTPLIVDMRPLSTFNVSEAKGEQRNKTKTVVERPKAEKQEKHQAAPPPRATSAPTPPITLPGVIMLSRADFAASDIGRIKSQRDQTASANGETGDHATPNGSQVAAAGGAPGGEDLYYAEWYREPTHAEMATYLPARQAAGWGMVICRIAERYHVEDCREIGETPGSGISRALRQASWQFLVRPPRVGNRPMIGAWVRIKFDLIEGAVK